MTADCEPPAAPVPDESFDLIVLPHLHAAHRLARWLIRDKDDAEDAVQEASLRAFRSFRTFTGGNGRAWFLRIVRNTCYGWRAHGARAATDSFDEEQHSGTLPAADPETLLLQTDHARLIELAMSGLPDRVRRILVLRELEGLSYREVADIMGIPVGTVMSGLSRARRSFRSALTAQRERFGDARRMNSPEEAPAAAVV
jgi:RNA polymerase sigma-70 factor (ECF subfamily)